MVGVWKLNRSWQPQTPVQNRTCKSATTVPTQRINLTNKLRLLILVHSPNPKSENWKHCHCDTFCSFLSKYFPFQVQFFLHRLQKKSHSFQNVRQFLYRFSVALRFHRRFVFFSVFVRFQRRINGKCFVKYMKLLVKATKIYGLSVADFIRKTSSIKLWALIEQARRKNITDWKMYHHWAYFMWYIDKLSLLKLVHIHGQSSGPYVLALFSPLQFGYLFLDWPSS